MNHDLIKMMAAACPGFQPSTVPVIKDLPLPRPAPRPIPAPVEVDPITAAKAHNAMTYATGIQRPILKEN